MDTISELLVKIIDFCSRCATDGEVFGCKDKKCPIFPYRKGHNEPESLKIKVVLGAIHQRCLQCSGGEEKREVFLCRSNTCPLWDNRLGEKVENSEFGFLSDDDPDWL
jgi:hypothetical protein